MTEREYGSDQKRLRIFIAHPSGYLTDCAPNGDGLVAFAFISNLASRGHEIDVAVERCMLSAPFPSNVRLHQIGFEDRATPRLIYMMRLRQLYQRLRTQQAFDIVHQLNPVFAGISLALIGTRTPIVLGTYISDWPEPSSNSLAKRAFKWARRRATRIIVGLQQRVAAALIITTPDALNRLADRTTSQTKTYMLNNGVEMPDTIENRVGRSSICITSLCGLAERKGAWILLRAFKTLAARFPNVRLVVGGRVADTELTLARSLLGALASRVYFVGLVSRIELNGLLKEADIFCMPSIHEPYGMAALEAMAAGLPIVASKSGGLGYLVPENGGIKVPDSDPDMLSEALTTLLTDEKLRLRLGKNNRRTVEEQFSWNSVINRLENIYSNVL